MPLTQQSHLHARNERASAGKQFVKKKKKEKKKKKKKKKERRRRR